MVRDGQVVNRPVYVAIGVTVNGERDILGLWAGDGSEGAEFWLSVLTEIKNRGVEDVCMVVCDGLKGLPESITTTWEYATVQACILHLIRNTFRYASKRDWDALARDLNPIYTAVNETDAAARFEDFTETWGQQYPAIIALWQSAWSESIGVRGLRRRDPPDHLLDQRDRVAQRPLPARDPRSRALPHRAGGADVPLPGHPGRWTPPGPAGNAGRCGGSRH